MNFQDSSSLSSFNAKAAPTSLFRSVMTQEFPVATVGIAPGAAHASPLLEPQSWQSWYRTASMLESTEYHLHCTPQVHYIRQGHTPFLTPFRWSHSCTSLCQCALDRQHRCSVCTSLHALKLESGSAEPLPTGPQITHRCGGVPRCAVKESAFAECSASVAACATNSHLPTYTRTGAHAAAYRQ